MMRRIFVVVYKDNLLTKHIFSIISHYCFWFSGIFLKMCCKKSSELKKNVPSRKCVLKSLNWTEPETQKRQE